MDFMEALGASFTGDDGRQHVPQLLRLVYHHRTTVLDAANLIDGVPLSEEKRIRNYDEAAKKNYLHWLAEATNATVLERQDFGAGVAAPNTLLYLMLRKALLEQLHNAAARWFDNRGVSVAETTVARNFMNIRPEPSLSKWEVMKAPVSVIEADSPFAKLTVAELLLGHTDPAEAEFLNEVRSSIAELAKLPTARLERCFTEHIDVVQLSAGRVAGRPVQRAAAGTARSLRRWRARPAPQGDPSRCVRLGGAREAEQQAATGA